MKLAVLIPVLLVLAACAPTAVMNEPVTRAPPSFPVVADEVVVHVTVSGFTPEQLSVPEGTPVRFVNDDEAAHQLYADPHPEHTGLSGFGTDLLSPGGSYTFVFSSTGTFVVHDEADPFGMRLSVTVE
jgi:plastocyanin